MLLTSALILWQAAATANDIPLPAPGGELRRDIDGAASHRYAVDLGKDVAFAATVVQEGIDLVVEVRDAREALLLRLDSPNGANGPEPVAWVSGAGGRFTLVVRPFAAAGPAGRYRLSVEGSRPATNRDRDLMAARIEIGRGYERREAFDYAAARASGERGLELLQRAAGPDALETSDAYDLLGYVYDEIGLYDRGVDMFARSLAIRQRAGVSDGSRLGTEANLAWLELAAGRYADAEARFRSLAERRAKDGGLDAAENALTGQSTALVRLGRHADAEALMRGVVERAEKRSASGVAPNYALRQWGLALAGAGRPKEAEAVCTRASKLPRHDLWDESGLGLDLRCLGTALAAQGRFAEAEARFGDALSICTRLRGEDALCAADTLEERAQALGAAGDARRARSDYERALRIRSAVLSETHPLIADVKRALVGLSASPR